MALLRFPTITNPNTTIVSSFIALLKNLGHLCISDSDFDLYTRFDADGGDLLDNFRWAVQINQALMDPHLEAIPGFGPFTTGSLSGGDAQSLEEEKCILL